KQHCQNIGRRDRILNSEIDANTSDRRHGVRRVPYAQQAWLVPVLQPVDACGQKLHVVPRGNFLHAVRKSGGELDDFLAEGRQAATAKICEAALWNDEGALPIVAAIEHDEQMPRLDATEDCTAILWPLRETHPQDVHRCAEILDLKPRKVAHSRVPS